MTRFSALAAPFAILVSGCTQAQNVEAPLDGRWNGKEAVILVVPCRSSTTRCVTLDSGKNASMAAIAGTTIVRDLAHEGPGHWRGRFVGEGKNLPATLRLMDVDHAEFRVCLVSFIPFGLCEVQQFSRVKA